jgi:penicillin G amidase
MKRGNPLTRLLVPGSPEVWSGRLDGLPVEAPVEVLWDRHGIPHIFASSEHDLFAAQGFVHARDRLWQMESLRRVCSGTLAEIAGEGAVDVDHWSRLAGFPRLWDRARREAGETGRATMEAYASGVNAFIGHAGARLPLEFRSLGIHPTPWTGSDVYGSLPLNAWFLQANYLEEVLALLARDRLTARAWNELYASHPGATLAEEDFFERFRGVRTGRFLPAAFALFSKVRPHGGGSNCWAVSRGEGGLPLLASDPHLGVSLPPIWHFCHLSCPTLELCGGSMPGTPGVVIGRNARVSWGLTNVLTDCVDLYVVRVDPARPTRYFVNGRAREMEREEVELRVAGKPPRSRRIAIHRTEFGPVLTALEPGVEAAVCLKWYGTLSEGEMDDLTIPAFAALWKSGSAKEALEAGAGIATIGQHLLAADVDGHIGWHATGRVPVRKGYTGRVPADGSSGKCGWSGFLPYDRMPGAFDPPSGRVANSNQRTQERRGRIALSWSWTAPYRFERIGELLDSLDVPAAANFARIHRDVHSRQAERVVPAVTALSYSHPDAREAAETLRSWDLEMTAASTGALLYTVFLVELTHVLAGGILRDELGIFLSAMPYQYTAIDRLLDPARPPDPVAHPLLQGRTLQFVCEEALVRAVRVITGALGPRRRRWSLGRLHTYAFRHPGATSAVAAWLLDRGPYPAPGGGSTVNVAGTNPAVSRSHRPGPRERYEVQYVPSLRMICPMADPDGTRIVGPLGQSGQPGSRHYDDLTPLWRRGEYVRLPLTRAGAEAVAASRLVLDG